MQRDNAAGVCDSLNKIVLSMDRILIQRLTEKIFSLSMKHNLTGSIGVHRVENCTHSSPPPLADVK
jgi:hypothetical protein